MGLDRCTGLSVTDPPRGSLLGREFALLYSIH